MVIYRYTRVIYRHTRVRYGHTPIEVALCYPPASLGRLPYHVPRGAAELPPPSPAWLRNGSSSKKSWLVEVAVCYPPASFGRLPYDVPRGAAELPPPSPA